MPGLRRDCGRGVTGGTVYGGTVRLTSPGAAARAAEEQARPLTARAVPPRLALLAALVGGLALAAAFPPLRIWPLAASGPALLVIALWRRRARAPAGAGA